MKQMFVISIANTVTVKCKYCNKRFTQKGNVEAPTPEFIAEYNRHVLMKHPDKFADLGGKSNVNNKK